jgi:acyl dehydratase
MPIANYSMATLTEFVGRDLTTTPWMTITQDRINAFADCTGDHQWIHVDAERAKRESPFGTPIAHGFLTLSLIAAFGTDAGIIPTDAVAAFNYGLDKVRFLTPVKVGARIRCHIAMVEATDQGQRRWLIKTRNTVEIEGETKPALVAEALALLVGKA